jgi:hypothetical protein
MFSIVLAVAKAADPTWGYPSLMIIFANLWWTCAGEFHQPFHPDSQTQLLGYYSNIIVLIPFTWGSFSPQFSYQWEPGLPGSRQTREWLPVLFGVRYRP